jgi:FkbM family methyltransferase
MIYKIRNFFKFLTILLEVKQINIAQKLASYSGNNYRTLKENKFSFDKDLVAEQQLGLSLKAKYLPLFRSNLGLLIKFNNYFDFAEKNETLIVTSKKTKSSFIANSYENIYALNEIFIEEVYDVSLEPNTIVLDIGMNVATASIAFAANPNVARVISFEPFKKTYAQALANIALNPNLSSKIEPYNVGLGKATQTLSLPAVNEGFLGASTSDFMAEVSQSKNSHTVEDIQIKDIAEVLAEIVKGFPKSPIYIKMDCEGAEYDIFEKLVSTQMASIPAGYCIEWHIKGKEAILAALNHAYHYTATSRDVGFDMGLIYAFKK